MTGVGAFGGQAAAQEHVDINIQDVQLGQGLIVINVSQVLENVDVDITIQNINVDVRNVRIVTIEDSVIQVAVAILGAIDQTTQMTATVTGETTDGDSVTATDTTSVGPEDV